ncbi:hypothetical protein V5799_015488, partial [Amblyomma americanum]
MQRRRLQQGKGGTTATGSTLNSPKGENRALSTKTPTKKQKTPASSWVPKPPVRMQPGDYVGVVKPTTTVYLKTAFQA